MSAESTGAIQGDRAAMSIRRPMSSCVTMTSTSDRPTSRVPVASTSVRPTRRVMARLSTSCSSATMWPCSSPPRLARICCSERIWRTVRLSASSGGMPPADRTMMLRALDADTWFKSCSLMGLPVRNITREPCSSSRSSLRVEADRTISSMASLGSPHSTTMGRPPSLLLARAICCSSAMPFSLHPRISVWPDSTTLALPRLRSSTRAPMVSDTMPIMSAKTSMPATVVSRPSTRPKPMDSACVPGSATYVQLRHMASDRSSPSKVMRRMLEIRIITNVTLSNIIGFAKGFDENRKSTLYFKNSPRDKA
mmetsp:Transcript_23522/g.63506  ORF Transcript_23522/g.63506 Transcript_23522/m.63506 type:complete len:309 (-) Transcript_23522:440-1366(-)